jgi:hypothetical protein
MLRDPSGSAHGVPLLFNVGFLAALLLLLHTRRVMANVVGIYGLAITWASGHLGPRPDPWLELRLREAFAEIDRDLAAILHDEPTAR